MPAPTHTQPAPSRRAVTAGLAWSVPAIAATAAAPAYAASCANPTTYTGDFTQANVYGAPPSSYTWTSASGNTITLDVSTVAYGGKSLMTNNLTSAGGINQGYSGRGDLESDGLQLQQQGNGGQVLTISLSEPVTDLQFTIADLDWRSRGYRDAVVLSPTPTTVTNNSAVQGAGVAGNPLTPKTAAEVNSDTLDNRSTVTYSGPITSFSLDFSSTDGTVAQQIFLTNLRFAAC